MKKLHLSLFLVSAVLIASCNKYDIEETAPNKVDAKELKSTHQHIKHELFDAKNSKNPLSANNLKTSVIEQDFLINLNYLNENGIEGLFEKYNIDLEILSEFEFYLENETNEDVYQLLLENFQIEDADEAAFLFNLIEVYNIVEDGLELQKKTVMVEGELKRVSFGCVLAIAGTVTATAGAAFVTGGASLIVFLVGKGIATAAIIHACT